MSKKSKDVQEGTKIVWEENEIKFLLIYWADIKDSVGKKPSLKTKEKAYSVICEQLNESKGTRYTSKQVGDKIKNMMRAFKEKLDNNNMTGRSRMAISKEEENAFEGGSAARPEFLLNSNGPGQTFKESEEGLNEVEVQEREPESELEADKDSELVPAKKKKLSMVDELHQSRLDRQEQFDRFMALRENEAKEKSVLKAKKIDAYERRTQVLERFLDQYF